MTGGPSTGRFRTEVALRWSDQDSYRHLNNARAVTLLEEARVALFFTTAASDGLGAFAGGLLVAGLNVEYKRQVGYRSGHLLGVEMWVDEVRAASFRIHYTLHDGPVDQAPVALTAWTRMATFDLDAQRPRRLGPDERAWLEKWA